MGIYTVSVGIEFPKKNLEDDSSAVVMERVPAAGDTDWREIGAETFPAEIAGLRRSVLSSCGPRFAWMIPRRVKRSFG